MKTVTLDLRALFEDYNKQKNEKPSAEWFLPSDYAEANGISKKYAHTTLLEMVNRGILEKKYFVDGRRIAYFRKATNVKGK